MHEFVCIKASIHCFNDGFSFGEFFTTSSPKITAKGSLSQKIFPRFIASPKPRGSF